MIDCTADSGIHWIHDIADIPVRCRDNLRRGYFPTVSPSGDLYRVRPVPGLFVKISHIDIERINRWKTTLIIKQHQAVGGFYVSQGEIRGIVLVAYRRLKSLPLGPLRCAAAFVRPNHGIAIPKISGADQESNRVLHDITGETAEHGAVERPPFALPATVPSVPGVPADGIVGRVDYRRNRIVAVERSDTAAPGALPSDQIGAVVKTDPFILRNPVKDRVVIVISSRDRDDGVGAGKPDGRSDI